MTTTFAPAPDSPAPEIRSQRLRLRRPETADAAAIARLASDYAVSSMTTRMPFPYGLDDASAFVGLARSLDVSEQVTFVLEHQDAGVIGCLGFHRAGAAPLEMGYWLGRPAWGEGLATEATSAALAWARDEWGRRMIIAGHFADNEASARVLIKAGFLYTGQVQRRFSRARDAEAPTRMMVWLA
jgi:RimJ/RimL family protein N-acetyltransferase